MINGSLYLPTLLSASSAALLALPLGLPGALAFGIGGAAGAISGTSLGRGVAKSPPFSHAQPLTVIALSCIGCSAGGWALVRLCGMALSIKVALLTPAAALLLGVGLIFLIGVIQGKGPEASRP